MSAIESEQPLGGTGRAEDLVMPWYSTADAIRDARPATYLVELEPGVYLSDTEGDPGRSLALEGAQRYTTRDDAAAALDAARAYRPFRRADIRAA